MYVAPFQEVMHDVQQYFDIDHIALNNMIYREARNVFSMAMTVMTIFPVVFGEDGIYGEHEYEILDGNHSHDIVLGDVGYAVCWYGNNGKAMLHSFTSHVHFGPFKVQGTTAWSVRKLTKI